MASIPSSDQLLSIGRIQTAYGIKGWVWLYSNTAPTTNIFAYTPWYLQVGNEWREVKVAEWRELGKGLVLRFADCQDHSSWTPLPRERSGGGHSGLEHDPR